MSDLGELSEYLSEFAAAPTSGFVVGPTTGLSPCPAGSVRVGGSCVSQRLSAETYRRMEEDKRRRAIDEEMWTFDSQWYPFGKYVDTSICIRQPNFGGPVIVDSTEEYYANGRECRQWDGYESGPSMSEGNYWLLPCTPEARVKWAFQYERYRWAQERLREHLAKRPSVSNLDTEAKRAEAARQLGYWYSDGVALLQVLYVATNVRFDEKWWENGWRWVNEGFFVAKEPSADPTKRDPSYRPRVTLPWYLVQPEPTPDRPNVVYARASWPLERLTYFASASSQPHPQGLAFGSRTLFELVPVGRSRRDFGDGIGLPMPLVNKNGWRSLEEVFPEAVPVLNSYGFGVRGGVWRWIEKTIGRGYWFSERVGDRQALIQGVDAIVEILARQIEVALSKSFFDYIRTALELYADRLTVRFSQFPSGTLNVDQAAVLRNIRQNVELAIQMRAEETAATFSAVSSLVVTAVSAVNAAAGAVASVVLTALQFGLKELARASGLDARESVSAVPLPFVRFLPENCNMPMSEAEVRALFPALRFPREATYALTRINNKARDILRTLPCPAGTTGTLPNCVPTVSAGSGSGAGTGSSSPGARSSGSGAGTGSSGPGARSSGSGAGGLLVGAGVLLLLSQLFKR
jgi:uncharacterized membrane protein YgcG